MKTTIDLLGFTMLVLLGLIILLGMWAVVLYEIRMIVRHSSKIGNEAQPQRFFADVPPREPSAVEEYWRN